MKKSKALIVSFIVAVCMMAMASICSAGAQDFRLVNQTGYEIAVGNVSPAISKDWQEDILGHQVLPTGSYVDVTFNTNNVAEWDIQAVFQDGSSLAWYGINLLSTAQVTLMNDGTALLE